MRNVMLLRDFLSNSYCSVYTGKKKKNNNESISSRTEGNLSNVKEQNSTE